MLIVPSALAWLAQKRVRRVFLQLGERANDRGLTGHEVARRLLTHSGLSEVKLERSPGQFTDHYDPAKKALRLTDNIAEGSSITSLGVVAHEVGHAVQSGRGYAPMRLRTSMGQRLGQLSAVSPFVFIGGFWLGNPVLMSLAILLLGGRTVFALVTLPVEKDASVRAMSMLEEAGLVASKEAGEVRRVLRAATFTYLTGLARQLALFLFVVTAVGLARLGATG